MGSSRGALIQMGECVDCKQPWEMFESEMDFYKNLQKTNKEFQLPKRCAPCRAKKKSRKTAKIQVNLIEIAEKLESMAEKSTTECFYTYNDELLSTELLEQAERIRYYLANLQSQRDMLKRSENAATS